MNRLSFSQISPPIAYNPLTIHKSVWYYVRPQHTQLVSLPRHDSLRSCCQAEAVQSQCLDICTFRLDFDLLSLEGNTCNQDFPAYMKCGADQSDHRHCCQQAGVSEGTHISFGWPIEGTIWNLKKYLRMLPALLVRLQLFCPNPECSGSCDRSALWRNVTMLRKGQSSQI